MKKFSLAIGMLLSTVVFAQNVGVLTGSFQSESQFYKDDDAIDANSPDEKIASNNYLKIDYSINNLTFGLRYESYRPPLLGYPTEFEGSGIVNRFASYQNDFLKVTAGNFYEQFGSGIILRTYEERLLGIDNSLDGVKVEVWPTVGISITGILGNTRKFFELGEGTVRGINGDIIVNDVLDLQNLPVIELGFSTVSKFEEYTGPDEYPENVDAYSYRFGLIGNKMNFDVEYVQKGIDPSATNSYNVNRKGRAILVNTGYFKKGFGFSATLRRLEGMDFRSERDAELTNLWINYLPSETRQHGYLLPNIYPYAVQSLGEIGGQVNLSFALKKGSSLGGEYGTKVALNYAQYNQLKNKVNPALSLDAFNTNIIEAGDTLLYRDFNIEVKRKLSKTLTTTLSFIAIEYNKFKIEGVPSENVKSKIAVIETLIKLPKRKSLRAEIQHLWTKEDKENWAGALIEFSMAPKWSFFALDQYNYGGDKSPHYYQLGFSYIKSTTRTAISYGRQRGGLLCVGGVCRNVPTASGLNLSIVTTF